MSSTGTPDLAARLAAALAQLPPDARAVLGQALAPAAPDTEGPGPQEEAPPAPGAPANTEAPTPAAEEIVTPGVKAQQLKEKGKGKAPAPQPELPPAAPGPAKTPNKLPPSLPLSTAKGPGKSKDAETPIDVEQIPDPAAPGDTQRPADQDKADSKLLDAAARAMAASHMNLPPADRPTVQLAAPITPATSLSSTGRPGSGRAGTAAGGARGITFRTRSSRRTPPRRMTGTSQCFSRDPAFHQNRRIAIHPLPRPVSNALVPPARGQHQRLHAQGV